MDGSTQFSMILRRNDHRLRSYSSSLLVMNLIVVLAILTLYAAVNTPLALAEGNEAKPVIHPLPYLNTTLRTSSANMTAAKREGAPAAPKGPICKREEHEKCVEFYATPLHFYGGEVQVEPDVFLIFWGSNFQKGTLETQLRELYNSFMTLPGGNLAYQGILTQYHGHDHLSENKEADIGSTILFGGRWDDNRESAPKSITRQAVEEEVHQAIQVNSWPQNNPNAQFIVFVPSGSTISSVLQKEGECGFHTVTTEGNLVYAFVPYQGLPEFGGACLASVGEENGNHSTMATASHEYAEAATDPYPTRNVAEIHGWTNTENKEIADICDRGAIELKTGAGLWVQELWGNNEKGCVLADPPEPLPPAPTVTTEPAAGEGNCEETLTGEVNPNESETHYHFEYGTTTNYGSSTPEGNAGFGGSGVPVSAKISGLKSGVTYHFRLVASSFVGTSYGADQELILYSPPVYDSSGNVWVTDTVNNRIEEFSATGAFLAAYGSGGSGNGQFNNPEGIIVDSSHVYVADSDNYRVEELSTEGGTYIRQFGSRGSRNGKFTGPFAIAIDPTTGYVLVSDQGNTRVDAYTTSGLFLGKFGAFGSGNGEFSLPHGVVVSSTGNVYVVDTGNNRVEKWIPGKVC